MRERFAANHAEHKAHVLQVVRIDLALLVAGRLPSTIPGRVTLALTQLLHKRVFLI